MKKAHIINDPDVEVGQKSLALCGKKWKVKVLWEDVPEDSPICRGCVDAALGALTASTNQVKDMGVALARVQRSVDLAFREALAVNDAVIKVELTEAWADRRKEKADEKQKLADARALVEAADSKKAKKQEAPDSSEVTIVQPPVAPDENTEGGDPL